MTDAGRRPLDLPVGQPEPVRVGPRMSFRARLTIGLLAGSILPLVLAGVVVVAAEMASVGELDTTLVRVVLFVLATAVIGAVVFALLVADNLMAPLRAVSRAVDRVLTGDLSARVEVAGEDELARLVESHNRLAADLERRNAELGRILLAIGETSPRDGIERLTTHATISAKSAFGLIDVRIHLGDAARVAVEEIIPGESRPVRAVLALPDDRMGVLVGHVPATRRWDAADQDLLELYASEVAVAIRNLELFEQVERQAEQLGELAAAKDDFLRGVSHNLQTPLTSIRAYADQLAAEHPDPRLGIIVEQADRLFRIVRQLMAVSRLESGSLRSRTEVLAVAPRVRRAWDALGAPGIEFSLLDEAEGWLAIADADQLDQVLWALLDNAVRYGRPPIEVAIHAVPEVGQVAITVMDHGAGIAPAERERIFERYERGGAGAGTEGTGLGLFVSRSLCRSMGGDLVLDAAPAGGGTAFTILLPGEAAPDQD